MLNERNPIPVAEAVQRVSEYRKESEIEFVSIEQSHQRVLAKDLIADHDVPLFDRSPYDGYAVRAEDTKNTARPFKVVGHIGAGSLYEPTLREQEAVRIMTGAPIPDGADAVIMLEDTEFFEEDNVSYVKLSKTLQIHDNISFQGEDVQKETALVEKGTVINPGIVALLATFGYAKVPVSKKPVIGVIATGSELLDVSDQLEPGKIRNSNAYMILAQLQRAGAIPAYYGKLSDNLEESFEKITSALEEVDYLITTGGVSVGDFDLLPEIYEKMNANVLFNKIAMRPGSVTTVATKGDKLLFGLSGNPSACYVGFELFARPVIDSYLGKQEIGLPKTEATLSADFPKVNPFDRFVRGHMKLHNGTVTVRPAGKDKSNMVHSLAAANCLIQLPGGTERYQKGDKVTIYLLES